MKALMAKDYVLSYPDPNQSYDIETDASDYEMAAVIKQNGWPVAYFSCKLRDAQLNYTTFEKDTLSIVEYLREFHSMLYGAHLTVHTDHKNMTHQLGKFTTQRVLRWRYFWNNNTDVNLNRFRGRRIRCRCIFPCATLFGGEEFGVENRCRRRICYCTR
jgi:hypothetical protein